MSILLAPRAAPDEKPSPSTGTGSGTCGLLSTFAIFVQLLLATIAFSTLIFKRSKERPMRPIKIWLYDVSKQIVGGVVIHSLNLLAATAFGLSSEREDSNPCIWYFLNIFLDTTFGVGVLYLFLKGADKYFQHMRIEGLRTGEYGNPPQIQRWWKQTLVFSLGLVVMKIVVVIVLTWPFLFTFGEWVLGWTLQNEKLQILFVMLILPLSLNICQFWVIDYILKQKTVEKFPIRIDDDEDDLYGLVEGLDRSNSDDEDDRLNMVGQASGRDSFDGISHHHHQQASLDRLDQPQSGPGYDDDEFEGSNVVTEIIVVKEECTDDQPWRKTPAPLPCIALRSPRHTPKPELDNGDDEEKDDDEFNEDEHIEQKIEAPRPQCRLATFSLQDAPTQTSHPHMKRAEASEIISLIGCLAHATSPTIARAQHYWRPTFEAQHVRNKELGAIAIACIYIAINDELSFHLPASPREGTIDYQPYDDHDPWIFLLVIMEKSQKLPVPPQLGQVIVGATNIEATKGLKTLLAATQKCLALSYGEAAPCKTMVVFACITIGTQYLTYDAKDPIELLDLFSTFFSLNENALSQILTKLKEIMMATLPTQNTKDDDAKSDTAKESDDPQHHEVIFDLDMVFEQFKSFSSENEDLWTCIDDSVPPDEHKDHSIYSEDYQDTSEDDSEDDDDNDDQGSDEDDGKEYEFKNGRYGFSRSWFDQGLPSPKKWKERKEPSEGEQRCPSMAPTHPRSSKINYAALEQAQRDEEVQQHYEILSVNAMLSISAS
ncbi:hypothetical protein BG006_010555 [Podila minutissima]|uniref:Vacuolar membrane protein n=1 Tax=Podila minutissima TaxID=64525 RepID=A0A9P5SFW3_9FUNG|nr:hypothetical protein BG006_010555 [Podila minutissima]